MRTIALLAVGATLLAQPPTIVRDPLNPIEVCSGTSFSLSYSLQNPPPNAASYNWQIQLGGSNVCASTQYFQTTYQPGVNFSNIMGGPGTLYIQVTVDIRDANGQPIGMPPSPFGDILHVDDGVSTVLQCANCQNTPPNTLDYRTGNISLDLLNSSLMGFFAPQRQYVLEEQVGSSWNQIASLSCQCGPLPCPYTIYYTPSPTLIGQQRTFRARPTWGRCNNFGEAYITIEFVDLSSTFSSGTPRTFSLYPNPSQGEVQIVAPEADTYSWELVDPIGRRVQRGTFQGSTAHLSLQGPKGLYQLRLRGSKAQATLPLLLTE